MLYVCYCSSLKAVYAVGTIHDSSSFSSPFVCISSTMSAPPTNSPLMYSCRRHATHLGASHDHILHRKSLMISMRGSEAIYESHADVQGKLEC